MPVSPPAAACCASSCCSAAWLEEAACWKACWLLPGAEEPLLLPLLLLPWLLNSWYRELSEPEPLRGSQAAELGEVPSRCCRAGRVMGGGSQQA
jgi:hypothetical protein